MKLALLALVFVLIFVSLFALYKIQNSKKCIDLVPRDERLDNNPNLTASDLPQVVQTAFMRFGHFGTPKNLINLDSLHTKIAEIPQPRHGIFSDNTLVLETKKYQFRLPNINYVVLFRQELYYIKQFSTYSIPLKENISTIIFKKVKLSIY